MLEAKLLIAPGLLATAALSSAFDRWTEKPLFDRVTSTNAAVVQSSKPEDGQADLASDATRFRRAGDGLFYGRAILNGVTVRFVLDTGATHVVLTRADAKKIGLVLQPATSDDRIETAGGTSAMRRVRIGQFAIAGHSIRNVDAIVVDSDLKTSLLGQNLLARLGPITLAADAAELQ